MKRFAAALLSLILIPAAGVLAFADEPAMDMEKKDFLLSSLAGSYEVIGRLPGSPKTYSGRLDISRKGDKLVLVRKIKGVKATGEASVQHATADNIPVIRASWKDGKTGYGATYLVNTDLDNYPRLTGYIYYSGRETESPGIEALFSREASNR